MDYSGSEVLDGLRKGDREVIRSVYTRYREKFLRIAYSKYGNHFSKAALKEVYVDCVSILYERAKTQPEFEIREDVGGYLIRTGLNILYRKVRRRMKQEAIEDCDTETCTLAREDGREEDIEIRLAVVWRIIEGLKSPGPTILKWFYIDGKSYEEIARDLKLHFGIEANPKALRVRKKRLIDRVRKEIREQYGDGLNYG